MVQVNGKSVAAAGQTIEEFLGEAGYQKERVAVERNGEIVPKAQYSSTTLQDGDVLEVVGFVGGG